MNCRWKRGSGMHRVVVFWLFAFCCGSYGTSTSLRLQSPMFNLSLALQPASAEDAAKHCVVDEILPKPGVLAPATLLLYVLQDVISNNIALLQANIRQDPVLYNTGGSSLWVMDPWGSCRAIILPARLSSYTGSLELSMVPCSWTLQYVCMEYVAAQSLSAGLTLPHNMYRTPTPPPLPLAVPAYGVNTVDEAPQGYRLVRSGVTLGVAAVPPGVVAFSGRSSYRQMGPVVNFVGRWRASGLDALRQVNARDVSGVVEQAMANGTVTSFFGDPTPISGTSQQGSATPASVAWAATPLPREDATMDVLRTSYITRVEGCSSSTAVQRILFVNSGGAAAAQGITQCISNFAEEAVPGGFLAFVEGYYIDYLNSTADMPAGASIVQLWFVWAVPQEYVNNDSKIDVLSYGGYSAGGVHAIAPRLSPPNPVPQCPDARAVIPPEGVIRNRAECGQTSLEHFACPSYMCCGTTRGRVGICSTGASACLLSACDPKYGLCGVLPTEALEVTAHEGLMGVAPAPSPLSSAPPYITNVGGDGVAGIATVRYGASVYVLDKAAMLSYKAALEACRSQTLYGLTWDLITLADAFSYEVTLLGRSGFLVLLNRVAWVQSRQDNTSLSAPGCLTVTWSVDVSSVQLVAVQATECSGISSVICKATWPEPAMGKSPPGSPPQSLTSSPLPSSLAGDDGGNRGSRSFNYPPPSPPVRLPVWWTPGVHMLSTSMVGIGEPNSGNSCVFNSFSIWSTTPEMTQALEELYPSRSQNPITAGTLASPVPLGVNVTLTQPLLGIATRPLVTWSAISIDFTISYQVVSSIAVQYGNLSELSPPIVMGSLDGTFLSPNASYGSMAPEGGNVTFMASYLSSASGWTSLQLNVTAGEVVVEVSGCRGGFVEQLMLKTSLGRLWAAPIGHSLTCTVPFSQRSPAKGYLVAVQVYGGSYVEELSLVWGTPLASASPPADTGRVPVSPSPAGLNYNGAASTPHTAAVSAVSLSKRPRAMALGVGVGLAVLVPVLVAGLVVIWCLRRHRYRQLRTNAGGTAASASFQKIGFTPDGRGDSGGDGSAGGDRNAPFHAAAPWRCCSKSLAMVVPSRWLSPPLEPRAGRMVISVPAGAGGREDDGGVEGGGGVHKAHESGGGSAGPSPSSDGTRVNTGGGVRAAVLAQPDKLHLSPAATGLVAMAADISAVAAVAGKGASTNGQQLSADVSCRAGDDGVASTTTSITTGIAVATASLGRSAPDEKTGLGSPPSLRLLLCAHDQAKLDGMATCTATGSDDGGSLAEGRTMHAGGVEGSGFGPGPSEVPAVRSLPVQEGVIGAGSVMAAKLPPLPPSSTWVPGQSLPPLGTEAWAQSLHAALFHKVLYHWKPPSLPLLELGLFPGMQPAMPPTPLAAPSSGAAAKVAPCASSSPASTALSQPTSAAALLADSFIGGSVSSCGGRGSGGLRQPSTPQLPNLASETPATETVATALQPPQLQSTALANLVSAAVSYAQALGGGVSSGAASSLQHVSSAAPAGQRPFSSDRDPSSQATPSDRAAGAAAVAAYVPTALEARDSSSGAVASSAPSSFGEYDSTELMLGRDVLVDVDSPSSYLGHGTSGVVRRGLLRQANGLWCPVAVKLLNQPSDQAADVYRRHQKTLLQEITILGSVRHPNVVQLLGGSVSLQPGASFLVEELCGRTLSHAIYDASTPYSLVQLLRWCCDIARGLAYLHPNIMHRDLKPSNVLLDQYGTAKISDFGLARFKIHTTLVTRDAEVGTTSYMSPECFVSNDFKVTAACDVYSLGVMMNEMVTRQHPWSGVRTAVVGFKVAVVGDRPRLAEEDCPLCPPGMRKLIRGCWAQHPEERPSSAEVLRQLEELLEEAEAGTIERSEECITRVTQGDLEGEGAEGSGEGLGMERAVEMVVPGSGESGLMEKLEDLMIGGVRHVAAEDEDVAVAVERSEKGLAEARADAVMRGALVCLEPSVGNVMRSVNDLRSHRGGGGMNGNEGVS